MSEINEIYSQMKAKVDKTIDALKHELAKVRAGRAHPSIIEHVTVDYYGNPTPLKQIANLSVEDSRTLLVTPFDKIMIQEVEKAILKSSLGLNPSTSGVSIRIHLPALTEERRRELVKSIHKIIESSKISVRGIRRDSNQHIKQLLKDKNISEDEQRKAEQETQVITDAYISDIDKVLKAKEADLMKV
jgi:ribosome recycling factor